MTAPFQLFPMLDPTVEAALRESIERFGVLVPVVKDQHGRLIDGHHRERIANDLGVKYRVDVLTVADDEEAREIARTLNADRRQLDADQRREVVAKLRESGHSLRAIGDALGVSQTQVARDLATVTDVTVPQTVRGKDGKARPATRPKPAPTIVPAKNEREAERAQAALAGLGNAAPAGRVVDLKRLERIEREHAAEQKRSQPVAEVSTTGDVEIRHGDFRDVLYDLRDVDAIITDPPYPREYIELFRDISHLASRVLKPNGVLAVMTGQLWLPQYIAELSQHMRYRWCGAYIAQGPRTRVHAASVGTGWKPILIFTRNDAKDVPFIKDDLFDSAGDDKQHHHWGQSESGIANLIKQLTTPGQLVVDPFLGGGTTAVVCRDLNRRFVGCDIDAAAVATSRERVA